VDGLTKMMLSTVSRWFRRAIASAVLLMSLGLGSANAHASSCGSPLVTDSSRRFVVTSADPGNGRIIYRACDRKTGVKRLLAAVRLDDKGRPTSSVGGYAFRDAWLVWAQASDGSAVIRSINIASGKHGAFARGSAAGELLAEGGPIEALDGPLAGLVAITAQGNFAWLVAGTRANGTAADALYVAGEGSSRRLDIAKPGVINRLGVKHHQIVWTHGAKKRQYRLL
jgi:hypothetical protein